MWNIIGNDGLVKSRLFCTEEEASTLLNADDRLLWCEDRADWFEEDTPCFKGVSPSSYHVFDYTTKQWIDPRTPETEWPLVRARRDRLLQESDWTQLPDVPLATKEAWAAYRQALRDITLQPDPFNIVWPTPPA